MASFIQKFKDLFNGKDSEEDHIQQLEKSNKQSERLAALHTKARKQLKKSKSKK
mgnify:FL=1